MGVLFSFPKETAVTEEFSNLEALRAQHEAQNQTQNDVLKVFAQEIRYYYQHPTKTYLSSRILVGLSTGLSGKNFVALFGLLDLVKHNEWIFSQLSDESIAYFEVLLIILRALNEHDFGEMEGRTRLLLLGLTELVIREGVTFQKLGNQKVSQFVAITAEVTGVVPFAQEIEQKSFGGTLKGVAKNTTRAVSTSIKSLRRNRSQKQRTARKKRGPEVVILSPIHSWNVQTTPQEAINSLRQLYDDAKFKFVDVAPDETKTRFKRDKLYLQHLLRDLKKLREEITKQVNSHYQDRAEIYGLQVDPTAGLNSGGVNLDPYALSTAIMDLLLPLLSTEDILRADPQAHFVEVSSDDIVPEVSNMNALVLEESNSNRAPVVEASTVDDVNLEVMNEPLRFEFGVQTSQNLILTAERLQNSHQARVAPYISAMFRPLQNHMEKQGKYICDHIHGAENDNTEQEARNPKFFMDLVSNNYSGPDSEVVKALWQNDNPVDDLIAVELLLQFTSTSGVQQLS